MSQLPPEEYWWQQVQKTQAEQAGQQASPPVQSRTNPWADVPGAASYSGTAPVAAQPQRSYGDMSRELDARQAEQAQQQGNSPAWLHEFINSPAAQQQVGTPDKQMTEQQKADALGLQHPEWDKLYSKEGAAWLRQDPATWEERTNSLSDSAEGWKEYKAEKPSDSSKRGGGSGEDEESGGLAGVVKSVSSLVGG